MEIVEYRGVEGLVAAVCFCDNIFLISGKIRFPVVYPRKIRF